MKLQPELKEIKTIASRGYKIQPVSCELYADGITPVEALRRLKNVSKHVFLLESVEESRQWGRYSFLGYDPRLEISCIDGRVQIRTGNSYRMENEDPVKLLRQILADNTSPEAPELPPFCGGLAGYWSYDYMKYAEPAVQFKAADTEGFYDLDLMLFDKVIAFDHFRQKIILICNIRNEALEQEYSRARNELSLMRDLLLHGTSCPTEKGRLLAEPEGLFTQEEYCAMVEKAQGYISEGDIFQVVLANRLEALYEGSLLDTYRVLRTVNPSPYMFYFSGGDIEMAGASPETLVKLKNGVLHTFPLAGTRPRGADPEEDRQLEQELLTDDKEKAEHNMLVDLGRNDIGKISEFGSVIVEKYMAVEKYSHVMHLGSSIRGTLRQGLDALDAVNSVLPAGTLSGAPKIRACQIIDELEGRKRGIYGGAIGYIDFAGNLDTCIAIRFALKKNGKVFAQSGAGIVADSIPENEYQECLNKIAAVVQALKTAQEGLD